MSQGQVLEFSGVTKQYGAVSAVSDFSARIEPGLVTGFLGPNGAGKTTTMRMLLGLATPTSGTATIGGVAYRDLKNPMQTVGATLEATTFHPGRTAANHLKVYATAGRIPLSRIDEVLGQVDLADAANRKVGTFSLGMRQRLGLATALLGDPGVLVLDEPSNGLDPEGIKWMRNFLSERAHEGRTIFVSSHMLSEIQQIADSVVIISAGKKVFDGELGELVNLGASDSVIVDSPDRTALIEALRAGGLDAVILRSGLRVNGATPAEIGAAAAAAGVVLSSLGRRGPSMEDIFLDLVSGVRLQTNTGRIAIRPGLEAELEDTQEAPIVLSDAPESAAAATDPDIASDDAESSRETHDNEQNPFAPLAGAGAVAVTGIAAAQLADAGSPAEAAVAGSEEEAASEEADEPGTEVTDTEVADAADADDTDANSGEADTPTGSAWVAAAETVDIDDVLNSESEAVPAPEVPLAGFAVASTGVIDIVTARDADADSDFSAVDDNEAEDNEPAVDDVADGETVEADQSEAFEARAEPADETPDDADAVTDAALDSPTDDVEGRVEDEAGFHEAGFDEAKGDVEEGGVEAEDDVEDEAGIEAEDDVVDETVDVEIEPATDTDVEEPLDVADAHVEGETVGDTDEAIVDAEAGDEVEAEAEPEAQVEAEAETGAEAEAEEEAEADALPDEAPTTEDSVEATGESADNADSSVSFDDLIWGDGTVAPDETSPAHARDADESEANEAEESAEASEEFSAEVSEPVAGTDADIADADAEVADADADAADADADAADATDTSAPEAEADGAVEEAPSIWAPPQESSVWAPRPDTSMWAPRPAEQTPADADAAETANANADADADEASTETIDGTASESLTFAPATDDAADAPAEEAELPTSPWAPSLSPWAPRTEPISVAAPDAPASEQEADESSPDEAEGDDSSSDPSNPATANPYSVDDDFELTAEDALAAQWEGVGSSTASIPQITEDDLAVDEAPTPRFGFPPAPFSRETPAAKSEAPAEPATETSEAPADPTTETSDATAEPPVNTDAADADSDDSPETWGTQNPFAALLEQGDSDIPVSVDPSVDPDAYVDEHVQDPFSTSFVSVAPPEDDAMTTALPAFSKSAPGTQPLDDGAQESTDEDDESQRDAWERRTDRTPADDAADEFFRSVGLTFGQELTEPDGDDDEEEGGTGQ